MRWPMWLSSSHQVYLPNIMGRLRNSSYVFRQYYAAATVCSAARSTFLTGLYAPQTSVYEDSRSNTPDLLAAFPTWSTALALGHQKAHLEPWNLGSHVLGLGFSKINHFFPDPRRSLTMRSDFTPSKRSVKPCGQRTRTASISGLSPRPKCTRTSWELR
jgi:hypothetical protein